MESTLTLMREHRAIEGVLGVMKKAAVRLEAGEDVDPSILEDCVDFLSGFVDRCHHAKEEDVLFPLLESKGMPRHEGPIGVMLHDHTEGRAAIAAMREALQSWEAGSDEARPALAQSLTAYVLLLEAHIAREDQRLFRMADGLLSDEDDAEVVKAFDEIEERKIGPGVHEEYHAMLDTLRERARSL